MRSNSVSHGSTSLQPNEHMLQLWYEGRDSEDPWHPLRLLHWLEDQNDLSNRDEVHDGDTERGGSEPKDREDSPQNFEPHSEGPP